MTPDDELPITMPALIALAFIVVVVLAVAIDALINRVYP